MVVALFAPGAFCSLIRFAARSIVEPDYGLSGT